MAWAASSRSAKRSCPHHAKNLGLVLEITIGGHRAHPQPACQLAHIERARTTLDEQARGGLAQALAKIGDVGVGQATRHASPFFSRAIAQNGPCEGRLADRGNNRVQIFDQNGKFIASWSQFSRPSRVFIDAHDVLTVTDSESTDKRGYGYNPQFQRGMRVGNAKTGEVGYFIPDPDMGYADPDTSAAEGVWVGPNGVIYGAEVGPKAVIRYVKK